MVNRFKTATTRVQSEYNLTPAEFSGDDEDKEEERKKRKTRPRISVRFQIK